MCKNNFKCEKCSQTSFVEMEKQPCEHCRKAIVDELDSKLESGDIEKIVVVLYPEDDNGDDAEIYSPLYEFLDSAYQTNWDGETYNMEEVNKALKYYNVSYGVNFTFLRFSDIEKLNLPKQDDEYILHKCTETELPFYEGSQQMCYGEFYSRPWDEEPEDTVFCCWYAMDCYQGIMYSKDFMYFHCEDCNRHICEQNPSNGYMTQYRFVGDCEQVCLKCLQEQIVKDGIRSVDWRNEDQVFAIWFDTSELKDNNFEEFYDWEIGMQYRGIGKDKEDDFIKMINVLGDELDVAVAVDIGMLGHGGGGFGTVYVKTDKKSVDQIRQEWTQWLVDEREKENERSNND